jgi:hypothetical protein
MPDARLTVSFLTFAHCLGPVFRAAVLKGGASILEFESKKRSFPKRRRA